MLLERFGLWDVRNERVSSLSRGMVQRLALCRVFLHEPALLLLDEPFSALDAQGAELLERELAERRGHATFLVATHEPERLAPLATSRLAFACTSMSGSCRNRRTESRCHASAPPAPTERLPMVSIFIRSLLFNVGFYLSLPVLSAIS